jgi:IclR family mhp operon transcriptional activator
MALNRHNGAGVSELAMASQISRQALYRILETLCDEGFVERREDRDRYELTPLVRCLSDGFRDEDLVRKIATPVIRQLQKDLVWPSDLATFHGTAMCLRETTRPNSPMTIDRATIGWRLSMLGSASGRAYLAWCPQEERRLILENLQSSRHPDDALAHDEHWVRTLLSTTRQRGYGERFDEVRSRTGAIAVPFHQGERVMGCLCITFIASALNPAEAARRHLDRLRAAAAEIELILKRVPGD